MSENDEELELGCAVGSKQSDTCTSMQYFVFCFRIPRLVSIDVRDVSTIIKTTNIYITIINTTAR